MIKKIVTIKRINIVLNLLLNKKNIPLPIKMSIVNIMSILSYIDSKKFRLDKKKLFSLDVNVYNKKIIADIFESKDLVNKLLSQLQGSDRIYFFQEYEKYVQYQVKGRLAIIDERYIKGHIGHIYNILLLQLYINRGDIDNKYRIILKKDKSDKFYPLKKILVDEFDAEWEEYKISSSNVLLTNFLYVCDKKYGIYLWDDFLSRKAATYNNDLNLGWLNCVNSNILYKLGIHNSKFITLHVKDGNYYGVNNYRDSDIDGYIEMIETIISFGFYVVRFGTSDMKKINFSHDKYIEYSHSCYQNCINDIYIANNALALIYSNSGPSLLNAILNKRTLLVNWIPLNQAMKINPVYVLPKKIIQNDSVVSYDYAWSLDDNAFSKNEIENNFQLMGNSSKELTDATKEFFQSFQNKSIKKDSYSKTNKIDIKKETYKRLSSCSVYRR